MVYVANENVTICSLYKQLYQIKKSCIIYVVAAVALQAQFGACEELLPSGPGHPLLALKGQFTLSCGLVGTCQSLAGVFFAIRADKYWGMVDLAEFYKFIMHIVERLCYN